ncbi:uncharacterized protein LOC125761572 [Anopheles funestus]|uniref:uncharacterized protein LOC125761572 n=1 Tax=Anopheles funestus TaxID=62324 RepID=UPI0020C5C65E|nr:uncharacterized protein LOC125761572 [Anopheles funestus]
MKLLILAVLAVIGASHAARPGANEVIDTFRSIVPRYIDTIAEDQQQIFALEHEETQALTQFHSDIVRTKETFVKSVTLQEDQLNGLMRGQNTSVADGQCMQFVQRATNETVNVIGVAYTTCINEADESLGNVTASYYGSIGALEQASTNLRLLDVFRGDNVFYTPYNIVNKLHQKEADLLQNRPPLAAELETQKQGFEADLMEILNRYIVCMTTAEMSFRTYIDLARQQLSYICGANLNIVEN